MSDPRLLSLQRLCKVNTGTPWYAISVLLLCLSSNHVPNKKSGNRFRGRPRCSSRGHSHIDYLVVSLLEWMNTIGAVPTCLQAVQSTFSHPKSLTEHSCSRVGWIQANLGEGNLQTLSAYRSRIQSDRLFVQGHTLLFHRPLRWLCNACMILTNLCFFSQV